MMSSEGPSPAGSYEDPEATRLLPSAEPPSGLPGGTRLREFEVERVIGEGGFSIVYAAVDVNLGRRVALKEYMPNSLARRCSDRTVQPRSARDSETFILGRRSFLNEARLLARFDHPALVKVHQFWEDNGTAYMVMPLYEGRTLKDWLKDRARAPDEEELMRLVAPLLDALEHLHAENVFHRDVAPDNVLLLDDGRPVLLDFGAARQVVADSNKALTAILKPSYAPIEQYADMAQLRQGPWTDVYALCAVIYYAMTGAAPPSAVSRSISDKMVPAVKAGAGRYSAPFLRGVDAGLAVRPEARPQTVGALRQLLLGAPATRGATQPGMATAPRSHRPIIAGVTVGALALAAGAAVWLSTRTADDAPPREAKDPLGSTLPADRTPPAAVPVAEERPAIGIGAAPTGVAVPAAVPSAPAAIEPQRGTASDLIPPASPPPPRSAPPRTDSAAVERGRTPVRRADAESPAAAAAAPPARARCLQILQRMQLGELPSAEDKAFLKKECS